MNNRISKTGKQQIEQATRILIRSVDSGFVAVAFIGDFSSIVCAGNFEDWIFDSVAKGVRSIRRINKDVLIVLE